MKNRVLLKSALFLLLIAADGLVTASEDDDLIFDPEGKQPAIQTPMIEMHQDESFLHRIKRGIFDLFSASSTTTPSSSDQKESQEQTFGYFGNEENHTLHQPEPPNAETNNGIERLTLETDEDNDEIDNKHEINNVAESQRIPLTYGNSDDEDLAGSGEIEGSANEEDLGHHPNIITQHRTDGKARFYRITLTVGEPYRREYSDRNSPEYRELSGNLTHALENLYNRYIPEYNHFASVVKISPTNDAFTSQVTLDIGSTFTDELEVRAILEQQLQYHSLDGIQVGPEGFTFRIFQAEEKTEQQECDQAAELRCRSGECVPLDSRCDGVLQCNDGSDEDNCSTDLSNRTSDDFEHTTMETREEHSGFFPVNSSAEVKPEVSGIDDDKEDEISTLKSSSNMCRADDTIRCQDGSRHICSVQQCDGVLDCDDGGDEVDCPHPGCSAGEFACDVNRCILESQRCNFVEDCQDGSDEHDCNYPACSSTEFICKNGQCIDSNRHCDGVQDCYDGSDELNCPRCRADEFECASGSCVSKNARCDGRNDCLDHSDEYNCNVTTCSGDQFRCLDGICLSIDKRCNGISDCRNGEDEHQCGCGDAEFRCTDGRCIGYELQCNGVNECPDGSDERDCGLAPCPLTDFTCGDGSCIPKSSACDGFDDCPRAEDELYCERECTPNQFKCATGNKCIEDVYRCDGHPDCPDRSDEDCAPSANDTTHTTTPTINSFDARWTPISRRECDPKTEMRCDDGGCVLLRRKCDNIFDCLDGSDERSCGLCTPAEWKCASGECLPENQRCDGIMQCSDGSDEDRCGNYMIAFTRNYKKWPSSALGFNSSYIQFHSMKIL